jgi:hypothetical protein
MQPAPAPSIPQRLRRKLCVKLLLLLLMMMMMVLQLMNPPHPQHLTTSLYPPAF